jgi:hypothetical protein
MVFFAPFVLVMAEAGVRHYVFFSSLGLMRSDLHLIWRSVSFSSSCNTAYFNLIPPCRILFSDINQTDLVREVYKGQRK